MSHYTKIAYAPSGSMDVSAVQRGDEYRDGRLNLASRYVQAALAAHVGRDHMMEAVAPSDLSDADLAAVVARLEAEVETERHNIEVELEADREAARAEHEEGLRLLPGLQDVILRLKPMAADHKHVKAALAQLEQAEVDLLKPPAVPTARRADPGLAMALGACRAEAKRRGVARGEELDRLRTQLSALGVQV